jgi:hypothetical protein
LIVKLYVPAEADDAALSVRVELACPPAEKDTLEGLKDVETPEVVEALRLTEPVKLPVLVTVMVEGEEVPFWTVRLDGFALIVKSGVGGGVTEIVWLVLPVFFAVSFTFKATV